MSKIKDPQGGGLNNQDADGKQRPYIISVWVEALDNDIETGKIKPDDAAGPNDRANRGRNTATLKFKLISDNDLVAKMEAQEGAPDGPYDKLDEYIKKLSGAVRLSTWSSRNGTPTPTARRWTR